MLQSITGINPEAFKWGVNRYDCLLCPGLQPGPPSQTPGGLSQRYWCVSEVTWPPQMELRRWRSSGPSSVMGIMDLGVMFLRSESCIGWTRGALRTGDLLKARRQHSQAPVKGAFTLIRVRVLHEKAEGSGRHGKSMDFIEIAAAAQCKHFWWIATGLTKGNADTDQCKHTLIMCCR